jgi:hypothetical protein
MSNPVASLELTDRIYGRARNGEVGLREFDEGVKLTLGATVIDSNYYIPVGEGALKNVCPPRGLPGIPLIFNMPDDTVEEFKLPQIVIRREDISPANQRWHSTGAQKYRAPAFGASPLTVTLPGGREVSGWDAYEDAPQAKPFDITYSIVVMARNRGGRNESGPRNQANALFHHMMRCFPPYGLLFVVDTIGDLRTYEAFAESASIEDEILEVTGRQVGFVLSLRVEAEIDLDDPMTGKAVTSLPIIRSTVNG